MKRKKEVLPKLKKEIKSFLSDEEGKITKSSVLKTGLTLGAIALSSNLIKAEDNYLSTNYDGSKITATHTNHASHASHASHSSNGFPW